MSNHRLKAGMLLVLPVPFRVEKNELFFESQACNGLEQWADNFGSVIVAAPVMPEASPVEEKIITWRNTKTLADPKRFELVPLPWAYATGDFISSYNSIRSKLANLISRSEYLQFAIGGLFGDWAAVAALEAHRQGRAYAVHTDRVEHEVILQATQTARLQTKIKARMIAPLMAKYHQWIIKNAAVGLFHGSDCHAAYTPFCRNSRLIHNVHIKSKDSIKASELVRKANLVKTEQTIQICYAGRMEAIKAPLDWVRAIGRARDLGANVRATWIGDGSLRSEMEALITNLGLDTTIELSGWESNREQLLTKVRESHLMLFTNVTPESPRCLVEALACGTPIVGYQSKYSQDLVKEFGGGVFVPTNKWRQLGELLNTLSQDRQFLSGLIESAGLDGSRFNDTAVFRHRSDLIKTYLPCNSVLPGRILSRFNVKPFTY